MARVDVAAARAHDQALERRQAHGGVDRPAVLDGRDRGAVAEVAGDEVRVLGRPRFSISTARRGHVAVAGAVEAVAADAVLLVQLVGQAVEVGGRRAWSGGRRCRRPPPAARRAAPPAASRMPERLGGLCSGASSAHSSMAFTTARR